MPDASTAAMPSGAASATITVIGCWAPRATRSCKVWINEPPVAEHRIDDDDRTFADVLRQLVDVRLGLVGFFVAGDADEADVGVRQQLLRRAQEAEAGAQNRHDDRLHGDPLGRGVG